MTLYEIHGTTDAGITRMIFQGFTTAEEAEGALESMRMGDYCEAWIVAIEDQPEPDYEHDPFLSDVEADADALASAGWGTDEDYGFFGDDY